MNLSRYTLKNVSPERITVPDESLFELPEKVLQFGTGVLLRGLPDYFIDKANGRVYLMEGSWWSSPHPRAIRLLLISRMACTRFVYAGLQNGEKVEENIIHASISRVLSAQEEWQEILECAHSSHMQVIISNTTEVGIQLVNDDIRRHPPVSFPGKLLAFLYERFKAFGGSQHSGMVIVPTELIPDNGKKLESIVLELAHLNGLEDQFIEWLESSNHFCNSLVDRIVPGKPDEQTREGLEKLLGYTDQLLIMSEVYRLWAIEGNEQVKNILSFAAADEGIMMEPDIEIYRELKLRLLNGTHTLSCGIAFLSGFETVKEAMDDEVTANYIAALMQQELATAIPYAVDLQKAQDFGKKVLDRFRNPHIKHNWLGITTNYSSKMKLRCIPILVRHYQQENGKLFLNYWPLVLPLTSIL